MSSVNLFPLLFFVFFVEQNVSLQVKLSGPGLTPQNVVLPCRYFTLTALDDEGKRFPINRTNLEIQIEGTTLAQPERVFPIRHETFYPANDDVLVRYRIFSSLSRLVITIKLAGEHVEGSPRFIDGPIQPHTCKCPQKRNFEDCLTSNATHPQILADLEPFEKIDMEKALPAAVKRFAADKHSYSFCHYVVKSNRIFRKCYGEHVGFKMFPDATLSFLTNVVELPDVEFLINLGDWPLVKRGVKIPMISWCKDDKTMDILLPTYEITEATVECMGRQMLDMLSVAGSSSIPWRDRTEKGFFRGRDSSRERLDLIRIGKERPDLIDSGITRYFFFRDRMDELGTKEQIPFFDFFKFKYQINMDGTVAAYRLPFLLAGGSLVFKQDSPYEEHFYQDLTPFVHYVPVKRDLSDLVDRLEWARQNDDAAHAIAREGQKYARENLMPVDIVCYHLQLLRQWKRRMVDKDIKVKDDMEEYKSGEEPHLKRTCVCPSSKTKDEL